MSIVRLSKEEMIIPISEFSHLLDQLNTLKAEVEKYEEKEKPHKFEIIDRDLIFHSTPHPTEYYLTLKCSCGKNFGCKGYQHWKVIDKNNVEKDYYEYEYTYCPHCGQRLGDEDEKDN